jgi:hypothetical protein
MILISLVVLSSLIYRERSVLLTYNWELRWGFIGFSFVLLVAGTLLAALVWGSLMHTLGSKVALVDHVRYYVISQLAKRLPGTIWYIAGRSYLYRQHGDSATFVAVASSLELVISCAGGALVALAFASYSFGALSPFYLTILALILVIAVFLTQPVCIRWVLQRMGHPEVPTVGYRHIALWLCLYIVLWIVGGTLLFLTANAVREVPFRFYPYVVGSWSLVGVLSYAVFFLPNNLGFTEIGLSLLLTTLLPSSLAVLVAILSRLLLIIYELLGASLIILFLRVHSAQRARLHVLTLLC